MRYFYLLALMITQLGLSERKHFNDQLRNKSPSRRDTSHRPLARELKQPEIEEISKTSVVIDEWLYLLRACRRRSEIPFDFMVLRPRRTI